MKKRLIAWLLILSTLLGLLSGCVSENSENSDPSDGDNTPQPGTTAPEDNYVTRGEWITMLGQAFCLDLYNQESPYYADVTSSSDIFPYVQSAKEWGLLETFGDAFAPDQLVTLREVAVSAAVVAGMELPDKGDADPDEAVSYARSCGIVGSGSESDNVKRSECEEAIAAAQDAFLNGSGEEKLEVTYAENLVDLSQAEIDVSGTQATLTGTVRDDGGQRTALVETASGVVEVGEGDVFITAPTVEDPFGVAYKVVSIEEVNGEIVIITEEPSLGDLFDELHINTTVSATADNIIWEPGVSATSLSAHSNSPGEYQITLLGYQGTPYQAMPLSSTSFSKSFSFGGGATKTWKNKNSSKVATGEGSQALEDSNFVYDKEPDISDFNGGTDSWKKNLEVENKFSAGYKISGNISINSITVTPKVEFNKVKIFGYETDLNDLSSLKEASIKLNSDITANLNLEGNLSEELKIATIPIPVYAGISIKVELYLCADASGSLKITAKLSNEAKAAYMGGRGLEHYAKSTPSIDAQVAIELDFGAKLTVALRALGVDVMDASAKVGGQLDASAHVSGSCEVGEENGKIKTVYSESLNIQADLYAPIITLSAGSKGTLLGDLLGLSKTWNVKTKDNTNHWELLHYEWTFWEETVITDKEGEVESTEIVDNSDVVGATDMNRLDLMTYVLNLYWNESKQLELDLHGAPTAPAVTWTSSDPSIARVDQNGVVTPVSEGSTIIIVSLQSDPAVQVRCAVNVGVLGEENWEFLSTGKSTTVWGEEVIYVGI